MFHVMISTDTFYFSGGHEEEAAAAAAAVDGKDDLSIIGTG